jgi:hypothetical protein
MCWYGLQDAGACGLAGYLSSSTPWPVLTVLCHLDQACTDCNVYKRHVSQKTGRWVDQGHVSHRCMGSCLLCGTCPELHGVQDYVAVANTHKQG